tara:strand:- start:4935 stop:6026 length:1092 start_codon:yes stop_codon:yes gene_type:complete
MQIINLDQNNESHLEMWNSFLEECSHLIIHTPKYKEFIEKTFTKTKTEYLALVEDDKQNKENKTQKKIQLILPIQIINHPILGKKIISSGFLEYGSFSGQDNESFTREILHHINQTYSKDYNYLEIRQGLTQFNKHLEKNMIIKPEYKRFELKLIDLETNWKLIQKEKRKAIRKSEREGIIIKEINKDCTPDSLKQVYKLYCKNMKQFGTPCFPKSYFENFLNLGLGKILGAYYNKKLVSLLVGFTHKDTIHLITAVSDKKYLWSRCNDAVHWHFIKYAIKNNYKIVDFGRVRLESGQFTYKKKWGCELKNLYHFYDLYQTDKLPNEDPSTNAKFKLLTNVWKTLPLPLTKKIGPWTREGIGK